MQPSLFLPVYRVWAGRGPSNFWYWPIDGDVGSLNQDGLFGPFLERHSSRVSAESGNQMQPNLFLPLCRVWAGAGPVHFWYQPSDGSVDSQNWDGLFGPILERHSFQVLVESCNQMQPELFPLVCRVRADAWPGHSDYLGGFSTEIMTCIVTITSSILLE